jgi:hypothetical protein
LHSTSEGAIRRAPPNSQTQKKKPLKKKKSLLSVILEWRKKKKPDSEYVPVINPMDENYDGYYDDKPTEDNGQNKDTLDPELIKRIIFIAGGSIIIVIFSIILLYLL